jgi:hypothetical protein
MGARATRATPAASQAAAFSTAVRKTLKATADDAEDTDAGVRALLLVCARSLDGAVKAGNPYAVAQLAGRALETMRELRLTPASRGPATDDSTPLAALLDRWSRPALRDPAQP